MIATELAYLAGIMDGEGSISLALKKNLRGRNPTYSLSVSVTNTNQDLLCWIRLKTGCGIVTAKPRSIKHWKLCFQLILITNEIEKFLTPLVEYMIVRKQHAELMLEFLQLKWEQKGTQKEKPLSIQVQQQLIHDELLALNKRGSDVH